MGAQLELSLPRKIEAFIAASLINWGKNIRGWAYQKSRSANSIYLDNKIDCDVRIGGKVIFKGKNTVGYRSVLYGENITLGYATTLGRNNILMGGVIEVGKFSQFAPNVAIYSRNHPYSHIANYINPLLFNGELSQHVRKGQIKIGNDVWIGHGALILNNLSIGDGAIIGAGSVVTKDIPSYAIAVGNPAKVISYRFPDEVVKLLLNVQWWNLDVSILLRYEDLFHLDFEQSPNEFRQLLLELSLEVTTILSES